MLARSTVRYYSSSFQNYDVVIAGGGMIGSTAAVALGKSGALKNCRIALIEAGRKKQYSPESYSNRVSAVNPSSKRLLSKNGIWRHICRHRPIKEMKVWGSYSRNTISYNGDVSDEDVAYIIENDDIVNAAMKELESMRIDVLYEDKIKSFEPKLADKKVIVNLQSGKVAETRLLIGADGANSETRRKLGLKYLSWDYNQRAVVATLSIVSPVSNFIAWQRFLPQGPIALLPLSDNQSSLVWSTTQDKARQLLQLPSEIFVDAVNEAFHSDAIKDNLVEFCDRFSSFFKKNALLIDEQKVLTDCPLVTKVEENSRAAFPLGFGHSAEYVKNHCVLIGDAAHRVHPLAGQGVNLGFRDINNLVEALSCGVLNGRQFGESMDLRKYESQSQKANLPVMGAIELIHRVYSSKFSVLKAFGDAGIFLTENIQPIKSVMKKVASS